MTRLRAIIQITYFVLLAFIANISSADEDVRLASSPGLSPDGSQLVFSWRGDIWSVSSNGGTVNRITNSPAMENYPEYSTDGKQLAFCSDRNGGMQIFVVKNTGGTPKQHTFHTEGYRLEAWHPNGNGFLASARRDHFWKHSDRLFHLSSQLDPKENLLFNASAEQSAISPDGTKILFIREGTPWWRKGYRGSQSGQLWLYDTQSKEYLRLLPASGSIRSPLWGPDGKTIYYLSSQTGAFNLWRHKLGSKKQIQLTTFKDDSVVSPCISRDGSTIVFRHLFDLYKLQTGGQPDPKLIAIKYVGDEISAINKRVLLKTAKDACFTSDGLELAFVAGGDVWVMDTVLKEPRQVTDTPEEEREVLFSGENNILYFTSDAGGQPDIWKAVAADGRKGWWQNDSFNLSKVTDDPEMEYNLENRPAKAKIGLLKAKPSLSFIKSRGDLWVIDADGQNSRRILESWNALDYEWSPDGMWLTYAMSDADFNRDVFVYEVDSDRPPFNLSRHPDDDFAPTWSPNGKTIAFLGRREGTEVDIYYVQLITRESEESTRDRKLREAAKKFSAGRRRPPSPPAKAEPSKDPARKPEPPKGPPSKEEPPAKPATKKPAEEKPGAEKSNERKPEEDAAKKKPRLSKSTLKIDFEGIHDRIKRVRIPNSTESNLVWSPDSRYLAFKATLAGKTATFTVSPPMDVKPKLFNDQVGSGPQWLKVGGPIHWLVKSVPMASGPGSKNIAYPFLCFQNVNIGAKHQAAFEQCWRAMRDYFYDESLNNRDWNKVKAKYTQMAAETNNRVDLARVVSLMLGELNGSHLGFRVSIPSTTSDQWRPVTAHLGARFDPTFSGPGFKVKTVVFGSPAAKEKSLLRTGDVIQEVDGAKIEKGASVASVLTGLPVRDIQLKVIDTDKKERMVRIRPTTYTTIRSLLYEEWVRTNRAAVTKASDGKLAYLHIQGMNMPSFYRFEQELYEVAGGKDGIVIDVRENGGGFTTDHLLTVLTQPVHAITVPRGGTRGYPQSRRVYATWNKPIVVLCNQNSFSNAEIFSHAIKTLNRGKLVGVPTSGSVISTGSQSIMDLGSLRIPFRGWYLHGSGEDMEHNGAIPDHVVWPWPGDLPAGTDVQLDKAIDVLKRDVARRKAIPQANLRKASER